MARVKKASKPGCPEAAARNARRRLAVAKAGRLASTQELEEWRAAGKLKVKPARHRVVHSDSGDEHVCALPAPPA